MEEPVLGEVDLGTDDLRDEGDDVSGRILLSGCGGRDIRPLALDMLFERCDIRVVIGCEIDPCPDRDDGEEDLLGPEVGDHRVHVEVFLFLPSPVDAEEALRVGIEAMEIVGKILLKGLVVGAYLLQGLALHDDEVVVSAVVVEERLLEDLAVGGRQPFLLRHLPGIVAHASFEHDESEERHHVVWEVALLDGSGEEQVGYRPYLTLIVHDIGHARRIAAGSIFVEQIVFCHIHFQFLAKIQRIFQLEVRQKGKKVQMRY